MNYSNDRSKKYEVTTPLIFGSLIQNNIKSLDKVKTSLLKDADLNSARKLKMIRADIFTLMCISMSN